MACHAPIEITYKVPPGSGHNLFRCSGPTADASGRSVFRNFETAACNRPSTAVRLPLRSITLSSDGSEKHSEATQCTCFVPIYDWNFIQLLFISPSRMRGKLPPLSLPPHLLCAPYTLAFLFFLPLLLLFHPSPAPLSYSLPFSSSSSSSCFFSSFFSYFSFSPFFSTSSCYCSSSFSPACSYPPLLLLLLNVLLAVPRTPSACFRCVPLGGDSPAVTRSCLDSCQLPYDHNFLLE